MNAINLSIIKHRISSIDVLRGLIMLIMALDHTRDFFQIYSPNPTDLATTTPALFITRWITHFCAALFVFLSGISINIAGCRRSKAELSIFLLKRGAWLIFVEFVLMSFVITLDPLYHLLIFQVIWVIGVSMILMAGLIWLPLPAIASVACLLFFGHNVLNNFKLPDVGASGFLWKFLFTGVVLIQQLDKTHFLFVLYALIPWTGIMLIGYITGQIYHSSFDPYKRKKILYLSGVLLLVLFFFLRFSNVYGDPNPWTVQHTTILSVISFFNVSKYPPSLVYECMTIGPGLIFLAWIEDKQNKFTEFMQVYGSVPFFYYILHFYLLRVFNIILFYAQGFSGKNIVTPRSIMLFRPVEYGVNLFGVYVVWILVIFSLYIPCRWFSAYKKNHHDWWLSYL